MLETSDRNTNAPSLASVLNALVHEVATRKPTSIDGESLDAQIRGAITQVTRGMSPIAIVLAYLDWLAHLAIAPGKVARLTGSAMAKAIALGVFGARSALGQTATPLTDVSDRRLTGERWQRFPFNVFAQGAELGRQLVAEATTGVRGVRSDHVDLVAFLSTQVLELLSPANLPLTNPDVLAATRDERGANLKRGAGHLAHDVATRGKTEPEFKPGREVAVTEGQVVYQNALIELIQYTPQTNKVGAEPVVIVPAWIMKYYILDLSEHNSMVRYLCEQGKTVFMLSWKNPTAEDRHLGLEDYRELGVMAALDAVHAITGTSQVHAVGYCLGGTLLSIAAAAMARDGDERLRTVSIFASQIDFREAGEIQLYLGQSELAFLESRMAQTGFLDMASMVNAFKSLRVSNQVYGPAVSRYLLGEQAPRNDLLSWNADGTRMPERMHREYLQHCYLNNDLAEARYCVEGQPVCVGDIRAPSFVLATVTDHVAPWQSVYKALRLIHGDLTFALTTAGHNAGIVSGPTHPRRRYQIDHRAAGVPYVAPETWHKLAPWHDGSWWPAWNAWLDSHMTGSIKPPPMGAPDRGYAPLRAAPGEYVFG